mmetsp:Transcript_8678/g.12787  ORF Transcript_8678/g.12787 Transcript_8678/m.12787 type:complete len:533 (+) Transcript_8678:1836-3434(+)
MESISEKIESQPFQQYADEILQDIDNLHLADTADFALELEVEASIFHSQAQEIEEEIDRLSMEHSDANRQHQKQLDDIIDAVTRLEEKNDTVKERRESRKRQLEEELKQNKESYRSKHKNLEWQLRCRKESLETLEAFVPTKDKVAEQCAKLKSQVEEQKLEYEKQLHDRAEKQRIQQNNLRGDMEGKINKTRETIISRSEDRLFGRTKRMIMESELLNREVLYQTREVKRLDNILFNTKKVRSEIKTSIAKNQQLEYGKAETLIEHQRTIKRLKQAILFQEKKQRSEEFKNTNAAVEMPNTCITMESNKELSTQRKQQIYIMNQIKSALNRVNDSKTPMVEALAQAAKIHLNSKKAAKKSRRANIAKSYQSLIDQMNEGEVLDSTRLVFRIKLQAEEQAIALVDQMSAKERKDTLILILNRVYNIKPCQTSAYPLHLDVSTSSMAMDDASLNLFEDNNEKGRLEAQASFAINGKVDLRRGLNFPPKCRPKTSYEYLQHKVNPSEITDSFLNKNILTLDDDGRLRRKKIYKM